MDSLKINYLNNPKRKHDNQTIIVQLSDLHFTPQTNPGKDSNLIALKQDITEKEPDIIIVTGDLVENGLPLSKKILEGRRLDDAFNNVKDFLLSICKECDIKERYGLFIVPGNHDYRFLGFKKNQSDPDTFREILGEFVKSRPIPSLGVVLCSFDSNVTNDWSINFSSGFINESELQRFFSDYFNKWKTAKKKSVKLLIPDFDNLVKLALLHHHPMPIAEAQKRKITQREELLLLKNAGIFMKEMARNGIDIILHGHRHYPGYSRAGFPVYPNGLLYIGVLAAGTVGKDDPFFSYNIITIDDEGGINAEFRWRHTGSYEPLRRKFPLLTNEEIRQNRRRNLIKTSNITTSVDRVTCSFNILKSGDDELYINYYDWRSITRDQVNSIDAELTFSKASLPGEIKFQSLTDGQTVLWQKDKETREKITGRIVFDPPLGERPINVKSSSFATNSFFFDRRDLKPLIQKNPHLKAKEFVHLNTSWLADKMIICVNFPEIFNPINPQLEVFKNLHSNSIDRRETRYCEKYLFYDENINIITFTVPNPMPSFRYKISWDLPSEDLELKNLDPYEQGTAKELRKALLEMSVGQSQKIGNTLGILRGQIVNSEEFKGTNGDKRFEISLMGFNENKRCLKIVALAPCEFGDYPPTHNIWGREFYFGEGVAGQALRRKEPQFYSVFKKRSKGFRIFKPTKPCNKAKNDNYKLVYSIPLLFPLKENGALIGALSFATCSNICGLHKIFNERAGFESIYDQAMAHFQKKIMLELGFNYDMIE